MTELVSLALPLAGSAGLAPPPPGPMPGTDASVTDVAASFGRTFGVLLDAQAAAASLTNPDLSPAAPGPARQLLADDGKDLPDAGHDTVDPTAEARAATALFPNWPPAPIPRAISREPTVETDMASVAPAAVPANESASPITPSHAMPIPESARVREPDASGAAPDATRGTAVPVSAAAVAADAKLSPRSVDPPPASPMARSRIVPKSAIRFAAVATRPGAAARREMVLPGIADAVPPLPIVHERTDTIALEASNPNLTPADAASPPPPPVAPPAVAVPTAPSPNATAGPPGVVPFAASPVAMPVPPVASPVSVRERVPVDPATPAFAPVPSALVLADAPALSPDIPITAVAERGTTTDDRRDPAIGLVVPTALPGARDATPLMPMMVMIPLARAATGPAIDPMPQSAASGLLVVSTPQRRGGERVSDPTALASPAPTSTIRALASPDPAAPASAVAEGVAPMVVPAVTDVPPKRMPPFGGRAAAPSPPVVTIAAAAPRAESPAIAVGGTPQPARQVFAAAIAAASGWRERATRADPDDSLAAPVFAAPTAYLGRADHPTAAPSFDLTVDSGLRGMIGRIETLRDNADATDSRIRLTPDALGTVEIAVRKQGDQVQVHFTAERETTQALLLDAQPRLTDLATARGLRLETSVSSGTSAGTASGGDTPSNATPQPSRPPNPVPRSAAAGGAADSSTDHRLA